MHRFGSSLRVAALGLALAVTGCAPQVATPHGGARPPQAEPDQPVRRLDRSGLTLTYRDEFETFRWIDPRIERKGRPTEGWKTWFMNGEDIYNIHNRSLPFNGEMQVYADADFPRREAGAPPLDTHTIVDGVLRIKAEPAPETVRDQMSGRQYISGMIASHGIFAQRYGVFEFRVRVPKGQGLWTTLWMLNARGGWPPEIDILEVLGHQPNIVMHGLHWTENGQRTAKGREVPVPFNVSDSFHTYSVDWTPQTVTYYFDDVAVATYPTPPEMHHPMFLIANLAIGGNWAKAPDATTQFPAYLEIDWVRVYQHPQFLRRQRR